MNNQQTPAEKATFRGSFNVVYLLASGHATCFTPFLHRDFGSEALGVNGIVALLIILVYAAQTRSQGMMSFLYLWLFMMLVQRIKTSAFRRQGGITHSRYDGYPWLTAKLVKNELTAKGVEPFLCVLAGALLSQYDEDLGGFVIVGFVSMIIKLAIERRIDQVTVQRMRDAEIEQRLLIERNKYGLRDY